MKKITLLLGLLAVSITSLFAQVPLATEYVMLQAFYWNSHSETRWVQLTSQANEIGTTFDLVWLPPASAAEGGNYANMGYHPWKWSDLSSSWGNRSELTTLINSLHAHDCKVIADIVINHRAGNSTQGDFPTDYFGDYGNHQIPNSCVTKDDEHSTGAATDYDYNWNVSGDYWGGYGPARDLAHSRNEVRTAVKAYLKWLKNVIGFDGWRYDLVKGYDPKYNAEYNTDSQASFSVGEYYQSNYDALAGWVNGTNKKSTVFDFCFKQAIYNWGGGTDYSKLVWQDVQKIDRPAGLIHSPEMRQYAVTFIDNHDTAEPHEKPWQYNGNIEQANAIMLAAPGIPCVFWKHWKSHKDAIKKMIAARKSVGLHSNSDVKVTSKNGYYESVGEGKNGSLICRVGSWTGTPAGYEVACSGNGWAYYTKGGKPIPVGPVVTMNPAGGYVGANGKVTLTATKGTIYYTTNGTTPSASSTKYTGPITITTNNTTIKAIAIDGTTKSSVVSGTFLTEKPAGLTVEFKAPAGWATVNLYAWAEGEPDLLGKWPGKAISKSGDYYTYTITETDTRPLNIIFNDGTNQTADITSVSADACYDGTNPSGKDAKGYIIPGNCSGTPIPPVPPVPGDKITLKVKASSLPWGNTCYVHAWNGAEVEGGTNVNYTGAWPGQAMTLDNDGYYTYTLQQDMVYALFNDGKASNGQQTDDIQRITASTCYEISSDTHPNMMQKEVYTAIETDCPTTGIDDIYATNVAIYPNPTSGKAIIASDKEVKYVSISNLSGWTVAASTSNEIDLSGLASAMYLVNIEFNDGSMAVSKVIKK